MIANYYFTSKYVLTSKILQLVTHFVDPRYWNVPIILSEDEPLWVETFWIYMYC